jgi:hypothetical protein
MLTAMNLKTFMMTYGTIVLEAPKRRGMVLLDKCRPIKKKAVHFYLFPAGAVQDHERTWNRLP